jgi:hypothetical protein
MDYRSTRTLFQRFSPRLTAKLNLHPSKSVGPSRARDTAAPSSSMGHDIPAETPSSRHVRRRRSGRMAIFSLVAATVGAVGTGAALWEALNSINLISADPVGDALHWLSLTLVMVLLAFASVILALMSLVRRKRWPFALLAIAVALVVTPIAATIGFQEGLNAAKNKVEASVHRGAAASTSQVVKQLEDHGVPMGPLEAMLPSSGQ